MIKRLKRNFIATNMIIVSIVIVFVITTIFLSSYNRMKHETFMMLDDYKKMDLRKKIVDEKLQFRPVKQTATITLSPNNNVLGIRSDFNITDEYLQDIIDKVLLSKKSSGILPSYKIAYLVKSYGEHSNLLLVDFSIEYDFLISFATTLLLVAIGTLAVFLLISIVLANKIVKPVEKAWKQQQQFVSDASHELKTPLTVVLANTSILLSRENQTPEQTKKWISYINDEATRMKKLVDDLLYLAKSDENKQSIKKTQNNLSDIVLENALMFEPVAFERNITFEFNIKDNVFLICDSSQMKQLVLIFLDNAFKYTEDGEKVSISLEECDNTINLSINNIGSTIPKEDIEHIFDRFYRVDKSRVRNSSSHGLGLAIASEIVKQHNGKINVKSNKETGTTFSIYL